MHAQQDCLFLEYIYQWIMHYVTIAAKDPGLGL